MPSPLLATKLYIPPARPKLVSRPRLVEQLNAGLQRKLTLVSAPAGYGKTTLVSDGIARSKIPAAWLSLDAADNDLARFFSYLIAALQGVAPGVGAAIQPILETDAHPPIEHLLTVLVNDVAADALCLPRSQGQAGSRQDFILVLDDYHVITELKIHAALDFLFDHLPPGMHVVIISRADPPMPLGRLRVQQELIEIREADLRFTVRETAAFMNDLGLALAHRDIKDLETRTEGWIAGLQLAALTLQGRADKHDLIVAFSGSHRHLIDYLAHEVMSRQPDAVQMFLLRTSVLERFNASLCDALTLEPGSRETLLFLEKANLFLIPLDDERKWFRYHHLFADFLRQRLGQTQPEAIPELYLHASAWYEGQGQIETAIQYALAAKDEGRAAHLLDEIAPHILYHSGPHKLTQWIDALPKRVRRNYPRLCIFYAWALQFQDRLQAIEPILALAEEYVQDAEQLSDSSLASRIKGYAAIVRAYVAGKQRRLERVVELSQQALELLSTDHTDESRRMRGTVAVNLGTAYVKLGQTTSAEQTLLEAVALNRSANNPFATLASIAHLMHVRITQGQLSQAEAIGQQGLKWAAEWSNGNSQGGLSLAGEGEIYAQLCRVLYEWNDLSAAASCIKRATEYYELGDAWFRAPCYNEQVYVHQALGEVDVALHYLQKVERLNLMLDLSHIHPSFDAQIVRRQLLLWRLRPDLPHLLAKAGHWAENAGLDPSGDLIRREYEYATLARVLIAQGQAEQALPLFERLCQAAASAARQGDLIDYLISAALAHQAQARSQQALSSLAQALTLAQPKGYVRAFVDEGPPMRDLLQDAARQGIAPEHVSTLLAALPELALDATPSPAARQERPGMKGLVEPLNDREIQILRLMAGRLANREIADELYLSVNTVKWYARNIYGKLGVAKRRQAVSRARELGILPAR